MVHDGNQTPGWAEAIVTWDPFPEASDAPSTRSPRGSSRADGDDKPKIFRRSRTEDNNNIWKWDPFDEASGSDADTGTAFQDLTSRPPPALSLPPPRKSRSASDADSSSRSNRTKREEELDARRRAIESARRKNDARSRKLAMMRTVMEVPDLTHVVGDTDFLTKQKDKQANRGMKSRLPKQAKKNEKKKRREKTVPATVARNEDRAKDSQVVLSCTIRIDWLLSCIVVTLIAGGIAAYFASKSESIISVTSEPTFGPSSSSSPTTPNPSTSPPSTSPPSSSPTLAFLFAPPLPEDCDRVRSGEAVQGQDFLTLTTFDVVLDVYMGVQLEQVETMDLLEWEIQKLLMPELVGCNETKKQALRHNRKLRNNPNRYIIANGRVQWIPESLKENSDCPFRMCLSATFSMELFLKTEVQEDTVVDDLVRDIFGENLVESLQLESPPFSSVMARSVIQKDPTVAPSWSPSLIPTTSPSENPTKLPSKVPTHTPTTSPSEKPTKLPSRVPTLTPTAKSSQEPSIQPAVSPNIIYPTAIPALSSTTTLPATTAPSMQPTFVPTSINPTPIPTLGLSHSPSSSPTDEMNHRGYYRPLDRPIRIACVGDSLTKGTSGGVPVSVDYPKQLQGLLGDMFTHRNLGINSVTAIRGISMSYTDRWGFETSLTYQPDIYLLMLGTNDSKYWETHGQYYRKDMEWILKTVWVETGARIIVGIPPYVRNPSTEPGQIRNEILVKYIQPAIRDLAISENVELVDMYEATVDESSDIFTSDGIHLSAKGYAVLAEAWRSTIQCNQNGVCDVGETCNTCPGDCYLNCD